VEHGGQELSVKQPCLIVGVPLVLSEYIVAKHGSMYGCMALCMCGTAVVAGGIIAL
jgi:hypothetical protein